MSDREYNRRAAVEYARRWAYGRNPAYYNFENLGGDCTNFISQCLYAGCGIMNYTPTYGWYYISLNSRAPAWTGVAFLYQFLTTNRGAGPLGREEPLWQAEIGDVIQLSFDGVQYGHSLLVTSVGNDADPASLLIATHTYDAFDRPLMSYSFQAARLIHILGARFN